MEGYVSFANVGLGVPGGEDEEGEDEDGVGEGDEDEERAGERRDAAGVAKRSDSDAAVPGVE